MRHFTRYIRLDKVFNSFEFTQHKSRQMYISNIFTYNNHDINIIMSYDTIIGFVVDSKAFITWGYSEYSSTTSKQITQLLYDYDLCIYKVKKFSYSDIEMLRYYINKVA